MLMKTIYIAAAALCLLLTGCGTVDVAEKRPSAEDVTEPEVTEAPTEAPTEAVTENVTETAAASAEETAETVTEPSITDYARSGTPWTRPVQPGEEAWQVCPKYTFEVDSDGVSVYYEGSRVQILEASCPWIGNISQLPEDMLTIKDFDFDGFDDLFIPEILGSPNCTGKYYCFDTSRGIFVPCEELDDKLDGVLASIGDDGLLTVHNSDSASAYEDKMYRWFSGELALVQRKVQYLAADGELYIDTYSVTGTDEELEYREHVILGDNNEWIGTEDVPLN